MGWNINLFSRYWRKLHIVLIIIVALALAYRDVGLSSVVGEVTLRVFYFPFYRVKSSIDALVAVNSENERLRLGLADAMSKVALLEEAGRENIRLRAVIGFEPPLGYILLPAEVITVSGDRMPIAAVINRGTRDGVTVGQPIINEEGLIGRIVSITNSFSTVQLLTDPANRVAVRVAESREMGIAKYVMGRGLIVDNIPVRGDVKPGDQILSSGLGGVYPRALVVGTVIAVDHSENDAFARVRLAPAADFNSLDELFVLKSGGR